ncbi:MAG: aryl-sulfate sulfotransferase [Bacteroidota bacterium]
MDNPDSQIVLGGVGGIIEKFNWDGDLIWSFEYNEDTFRQHHDVYPISNGNVLILAASVMDAQESISLGRDPSTLPENILYNEKIIEIEPVGLNSGNIKWEWNIKDHFIQDFDITKANFGEIMSNPRKLDINFLNDFDPNKNWLHINSIQYSESLDQIVLSSRKLSEVWVIDHSTTIEEAASNTGGIYNHGGDFLYRWGNPKSYNLGDDTNRELYGQHTPYIIPPGMPNAGKMMIFNNGFGRIPSYSEVKIINLPINPSGVYSYSDNMPFGPDSIFFNYPSNPPIENTNFYSAIMSNAQQLPNGNILLCQSQGGNIFEINPQNDIVWNYIVPLDSDTGVSFNQGDVNLSSNLTFRAIKYDNDYPAFSNRDLTPGETLETNSGTTTDCSEILITTKTNHKSISISPNPVHSSFVINIENFDNQMEVEIYDMSGKVLLKSRYKNINIENFMPGLYFVKFKLKNIVHNIKILKK